MVFSIQHHSTCSIQELIGHSTCSIQELIGGKMLQFLLPFVGRQSEPRFASQAAQKQQVIVQAGLLQHDWVVAVIRCPYLVAIFVDDNCDPLGLAERTNVSCCPVCFRMTHILDRSSSSTRPFLVLPSNLDRPTSPCKPAPAGTPCYSRPFTVATTPCGEESRLATSSHSRCHPQLPLRGHRLSLEEAC